MGAGLEGIVIVASQQVSPKTAFRGLCGFVLGMQRAQVGSVAVSLSGLPKTAASWAVTNASLKRGAETYPLTFAPGALVADETGWMPAFGAFGGFEVVFDISGIYDDASIFNFAGISIVPALSQT